MTALRAIHAGMRQLGLDDEAKRALYQRVTGQRSAADMDEGEREAVVAELRRLGFKGVSNGPRKGRKALAGPYATKLQALWIAGWNLGLVRNRNDRALLAFVKRQTGLDHTRFLHHHDDATKAIEALKGWLARDGGVDWGKWKNWQRHDGCRIAMAQCLILDADTGARDFWPTVCEAGGIAAPNQFKTEHDWHAVMNTLGERIREQSARPDR